MKKIAVVTWSGRIHTWESSIKRIHPAFTDTLRARCKNSTHYNITNFRWIKSNLVNQCLQNARENSETDLFTHVLLTIMVRGKIFKLHKTNINQSIVIINNPDLQNRRKQVIGKSILKSPMLSLAYRGTISSAKVTIKWTNK